MDLPKKYILSGFSRASASYDHVASVQKECAARLAECLTEHFPEFYPRSILDLGTGTGYVPEILLRLFPQSDLSLNDISPEMLSRAKKKLPRQNIDFILGDMEELNFSFHNLVISNLCLQWTNDLNGVIKKFHEKSDVFAFTCLLQGTFDEWTKIFLESSLPAPTHDYPSEEELENYLLSLNPTKHFCRSEEFTLTFSSARDFMKYLKYLGANCSKQNIFPTDLRKVINIYTDKIDITYRVFFGILSR